MPRAIRTPVFVLPLLLLGQSTAEENYTVHPQDTGAALENPGMGWILYYYSNIPTNYGSRLKPSDTVDEFPGVTTVYLRPRELSFDSLVAARVLGGEP